MSTAPKASSPPVRWRLPGTVVALGFVSLLTDMASEMIYPLLPAFLLALPGFSKATLGLVEGVAETTAALLRLPSGVLSDRLPRRKPLIVLGYGVAGLVRPLMGLAVAPWQVLAVRFTDRLGKGLRGAPRDALIADVTAPQGRGRAFGFHRAMDHAGAAIGPILAFAFLTFWPGELRTLFLLAVLPGIAVLLVLILAVREEPRDRVPVVDRHVVDRPVVDTPVTESGPVAPQSASASPSSQPRSPSAHWSLAQFDPRFRWYLAALVIFVLGNSTDLFLLVRLQELGLETRYAPLVWCGFHLAKSLFNLWGGHWTDRVEPGALLLGGWLLYAAVYLGFGLATSVTQGLALFVLYAIYYGLTEPAEKALVARWSPAGARGAGFGWFNLAIGLGALPASLAFGWIWDQPGLGPLAAFGLGAALALTAAALLSVTFVAHSTQRQRPDSQAP
jgi:MFS family permease